MFYYNYILNYMVLLLQFFSREICHESIVNIYDNLS